MNDKVWQDVYDSIHYKEVRGGVPMQEVLDRAKGGDSVVNFQMGSTEFNYGVRLFRENEFVLYALESDKQNWICLGYATEEQLIRDFQNVRVG